MLKILSKAPSELVPYEYNNKEHSDEQITKIANSIKEFWFLQPIVIDSNNVVVVGHWRVLAAKKLWYKEIPCVIAEWLTEEQINKYRIRDNKLNESEWNIANLKQQLDELENMNLWDLQYTKDEIFPEFKVPEFDPKEFEAIANKANEVVQENNQKTSWGWQLSLTVFVNDTWELEMLKKDLIELWYTNFY